MTHLHRLLVLGFATLALSLHGADAAANWKQYCAKCHGPDGKGNKALGAPNLTDDYWLHGWGEAAIVNAIKYGKNNVMPAQAPKLTPEQIHVVAAYVLSLGGVKPAVK